MLKNHSIMSRRYCYIRYIYIVGLHSHLYIHWWTCYQCHLDKRPVLGNTPVSVLVNGTTAQYIHTLNISGTELPAVYGCSVSNNKPSSANATAALGIIFHV